MRYVIYDETYRLENEQLIKKVEGYNPCTSEEVIEYYKDKNAIAIHSDQEYKDGRFELSGYAYMLMNDKKHAINFQGIITSIDDLNMAKISIYDNKGCFIQVWAEKIEMGILSPYDGFLELDDTYILQYNCLMKKTKQDQICTILETVNFYKDKAAIKIELSNNRKYYMANDYSLIIDDDVKITDINMLNNLDITNIDIHDDFYGWITVWKKKEAMVFKITNGELKVRF